MAAAVFPPKLANGHVPFSGSWSWPHWTGERFSPCKLQLINQHVATRKLPNGMWHDRNIICFLIFLRQLSMEML